mmetsp:Transcript_18761/g.51557  ORF Transcript_18761/g.51557 Transcript_18761/m.51557 type:complete len:330 (+) Transcript_18761:775-1764(+)
MPGKASTLSRPRTAVKWFFGGGPGGGMGFCDGLFGGGKRRLTCPGTGGGPGLTTGSERCGGRATRGGAKGGGRLIDVGTGGRKGVVTLAGCADSRKGMLLGGRAIGGDTRRISSGRHSNMAMTIWMIGKATIPAMIPVATKASAAWNSSLECMTVTKALTRIHTRYKTKTRRCRSNLRCFAARPTSKWLRLKAYDNAARVFSFLSSVAKWRGLFSLSMGQTSLSLLSMYTPTAAAASAKIKIKTLLLTMAVVFTCWNGVKTSMGHSWKPVQRHEGQFATSSKSSRSSTKLSMNTAKSERWVVTQCPSAYRSPRALKFVVFTSFLLPWST